jgi:hypothetical protein
VIGTPRTNYARLFALWLFGNLSFLRFSAIWRPKTRHWHNALAIKLSILLAAFNDKKYEIRKVDVGGTRN